MLEWPPYNIREQRAGKDKAPRFLKTSKWSAGEEGHLTGSCCLRSEVGLYFRGELWLGLDCVGGI